MCLLSLDDTMKSNNKKNRNFNKSKKKYQNQRRNPPITMDKDLDVYASEIFYLIKARNCAVACARYVLIDE
jgi:hypothetical protein